jgi:hypothetical protein
MLDTDNPQRRDNDVYKKGLSDCSLEDAMRRTLSWSRLSEQILRFDKWSVCRVRPPSGMAVV